MDLVQLVVEPRRRQILRLLWDRERAVGDLVAAMDMSYAAIGHHLTALRRAGAVGVRNAGRQRLYRADRDALGPYAAMLEAMWHQDLSRLAEAAEAAERSHP